MKNLYLIGMMGCGKSTCARLLGERLGMTVLDTDEEIRRGACLTVSEIFSRYGEAYFRQLETETLRTISEREDLIVACGGGLPLREENRRLLRESGTVIFLDVPFRICYQRIANTDRPIVRRSTREELYQLYSYRRGIYRAHSTRRIRAIKSPTATVEEILRLLQHEAC